MTDMRSRLVFIISDDEHAWYDLWLCALDNGTNAFATRDCSLDALLALGQRLAVVVIDLESSGAAWRFVEHLRKNEPTMHTPIVLRCRGQHAISPDLSLTVQPIWRVEAEQGVGAACDALTAALGNGGQWPFVHRQITDGAQHARAVGGAY